MFLLKDGTINGYATNHVIVLGPLALWDFGNIFLPNIGEDQKKVLQFEYWAPGTVSYGKNRPWLLRYAHNNVR